MSTENPAEKQTKKAIKKQVKKLVRAYGADEALVLMTELVGKAPAKTKKEAAAGHDA